MNKITLTAALSEKCNLNCTYCNINKNSKSALDPQNFINEYYRLTTNPNVRVNVDFYGGEPLFHLNSIKKILGEIGKDKNITFFLPTNGLLLTEEIVEILVKYKVNVSLSFDGLWQDKNRPLLNGRGTLRQYYDKKELFHKVPNIKCHTMITRGCYNLLENYLYIKNEFGFNTELTLIRDTGVWSAEDIIFLKQGISELFSWYCEHPHEEMPNFILGHLKHFLDYHIGGHTSTSCGAGKTILMMNENNEVLPCVRFEKNKEWIGRIPSYLNMEKCSPCEIKNYCNKGCLYEQIKNGGPIDELCQVYRHIFFHVKRLIGVLKEHDTFKRKIMEEYI